MRRPGDQPRSCSISYRSALACRSFSFADSRRPSALSRLRRASSTPLSADVFRRSSPTRSSPTSKDWSSALLAISRRAVARSRVFSAPASRSLTAASFSDAARSSASAVSRSWRRPGDQPRSASISSWASLAAFAFSVLASKASCALSTSARAKATASSARIFCPAACRTGETNSRAASSALATCSPRMGRSSPRRLSIRRKACRVASSPYIRVKAPRMPSTSVEVSSCFSEAISTTVRSPPPDGEVKRVIGPSPSSACFNTVERSDIDGVTTMLRASSDFMTAPPLRPARPDRACASAAPDRRP